MSPRRRWAASVVAMSATFMAIMDVFVVLVAAPAIQRDLGTSDAEIQLVLAAYQLAYAVLLVTAGRLGDRLGRRTVFLTGMAVFTVASLACGLAGSAAGLIGARVVQGLGAALMFPQVFAILTELMPAAHRRRAFGVLGAVIGLSTIVGQLVGGLLIQLDLFGTGWRPVFWINVPIGVAALLLARALVPQSRARSAAGLDLPGLALLVPTLFLLVVPLVMGRERGWPAWTWACLVGSLLVGGVFVRVERGTARRGGAPLVDLGLFAQRAFSVGTATVLVFYAGLNSFFLVLSVTLQSGLGLSALGAGLTYSPLAVAFLTASLLAGRLGAGSVKTVLVAGAATTSAGFALAVLVPVVSGGLPVRWLLVALVVQGVGEGLLQTPLLNAVLARVTGDDVGVASGVLSTAQQVGGALGVALVGTVFFGLVSAAGRPGRAAYEHGFAVATLLNVAVGITCILLVLALPAAADAAEPSPVRAGR